MVFCRGGQNEVMPLSSTVPHEYRWSFTGSVPDITHRQVHVAG